MPNPAYSSRSAKTVGFLTIGTQSNRILGICALEMMHVSGVFAKTSLPSRGRLVYSNNGWWDKRELWVLVNTEGCANIFGSTQIREHALHIDIDAGEQGRSHFARSMSIIRFYELQLAACIENKLVQRQMNRIDDPVFLQPEALVLALFSYFVIVAGRGR